MSYSIPFVSHREKNSPQVYYTDKTGISSHLVYDPSKQVYFRIGMEEAPVLCELNKQVCLTNLSCGDIGFQNSIIDLSDSDTELSNLIFFDNPFIGIWNLDAYNISPDLFTDCDPTRRLTYLRLDTEHLVVMTGTLAKAIEQEAFVFVWRKVTGFLSKDNRTTTTSPIPFYYLGLAQITKGSSKSWLFNNQILQLFTKVKNVSGGFPQAIGFPDTHRLHKFVRKEAALATYMMLSPDQTLPIREWSKPRPSEMVRLQGDVNKVVSQLSNIQAQKQNLSRNERDYNREKVELQRRIADMEAKLTEIQAYFVRYNSEEVSLGKKRTELETALSPIVKAWEEDTSTKSYTDLTKWFDVEFVSIRLYNTITHHERDLTAASKDFKVDWGQEILQGVTIVTKEPTCITDSHGKKYVGGPYVIHLQIQGVNEGLEGHIKLKDTNSFFGVAVPDSFPGNLRVWIHPHAQHFATNIDSPRDLVWQRYLTEYTRMCAGEAHPAWFKALQDRDFGRILLVTKLWLETATNADAWGESIVRFPSWDLYTKAKEARTIGTDNFKVHIFENTQGLTLRVLYEGMFYSFKGSIAPHASGVGIFKTVYYEYRKDVAFTAIRRTSGYVELFPEQVIIPGNIDGTITLTSGLVISISEILLAISQKRDLQSLLPGNNIAPITLGRAASKPEAVRIPSPSKSKPAPVTVEVQGETGYRRYGSVQADTAE